MNHPSGRWGTPRERDAVGHPSVVLDVPEPGHRESARTPECDDAEGWSEGAVAAERSGLSEVDTGLLDGVSERDVETWEVLPVLPASSEPGAETDLHAELTGRHSMDALMHSGDYGDGPDWIGRGAWVLTGVLVAAAAVALLMWEPAEDEALPASRTDGQHLAPLNVTPTVVPLAQAQVASRDGSISRAGVLLQRGATLREGDLVAFAEDGCFRVQPGAQVCARAGSTISLESLGLRARVMAVRDGLALAALDEPSSEGAFVLRADGATARSTGVGIFAVRLDADQLHVRVHEGSVSVAWGAENATVGQGQVALWLRGTDLPTITALGRREAQADTALARVSDEPRRERAFVAAPNVPAPPVEEEVDEAQPASAANALPLDEMMRTAVELARAQRHSDAARVYEDLRVAYPDSHEADLVLVRLGDLRLQHLSDPEGALSAYKAYLERSGGALVTEAKLGAIRALRALGETAAEREAIELYLADHPGGSAAPKLRERLVELQN